MPFSSLTEPRDLARAQAALDAAWQTLQSTIPEGLEERDRIELAYIVAALASAHGSESDLTEAAIRQFKEVKGLD